MRWEEYPKYRDFTLRLVEDFDTPIDLDSDPIWTWSDGGLPFARSRFVKDNIRFGGGKMKIGVTEGKPKNQQTCSAAEVEHVKGTYSMTSGEMRTRHNMFRYGRYEVRMKTSSVQPHNVNVNGNYISSMFLFRDGKFKHWREIDFEFTGDRPGQVVTSVLYGENKLQWSAEMSRTTAVNTRFNTRAAFHTYAFEWLPQSIKWFIDGRLVRTYSGDRTGAVPIPELPGKIMMNFWIFDYTTGFGGKEIWNNRYPMVTEYDWFRFYQWNGDLQYPCAGLGTSCLTEDDMYLTKNNPCDGIEQEGTVDGKAPCQTTEKTCSQ